MIIQNAAQSGPAQISAASPSAVIMKYLSDEGSAAFRRYGAAYQKCQANDKDKDFCLFSYNLSCRSSVPAVSLNCACFVFEVRLRSTRVRQSSLRKKDTRWCGP